jgi:monoamine oxidase
MLAMTLSRRQFSLGLAALASSAPALARTASPRPPAMLDTIVIGAGMAGLNAALLLEAEGQRVLVLEGRQRVGGRVHSLLDQPGTPEMGFNTMGAGYGRGIDAARRAGVELVEVGSRYRKAPPQALFLDGETFDREKWASWPGNPLPPALRTMMPWEVVPRLMAQHNPLPDWTQWSAPENAAHDISLYSFLRQHGLSDAAIKLCNDTSPSYGNSAWDVSALMLEWNDGFIKGQIAAGTDQFAVKGGNANLPFGLARKLKGDLLTGKRVVGVESESEQASAYCDDGTKYTARRVICALPLGAMRRMRFWTGLPVLQAQAIAAVPYQQLTNIFVTVDRPYWQEDGLSPGMWTNSPLGTVYPQYFGASDSEVTGLLVQGRGELAMAWDRMGREAAMATVIDTLERFRPAAKGAVKAVHFHSWGQEEFSTGAWAVFMPGQIRELHAAIAQPAGRIHFCGEHTSTGARGLEAALESSERAAIEVLS